MTTRADLYRALAADGLTAAQIERATEGSRQAIADALKRAKQPGRPRKPRCPHCGQPMPRETTP